MKISAGHFIGAREPPQHAVLVVHNPIAIVTPHDLTSVSLYSVAQLIPCTGSDRSAMLSRWSDGTICLTAPEEAQ